MLLWSLLALGLCILASAVFSGSETGLYSLSRLRIEAADGAGSKRSDRIIRRLLRDDTGLLITLLVGNNLALELCTHFGDQVLAPLAIPASMREVAVTIFLTPPLFFLGELLPKDLFRRRPHALVGALAPLIAGIKFVLLPITLPVKALTVVLGRLAGLDSGEVARVQGNEAVIDLLRHGDRPLPAQAESMARNVLALRSLRVARVMVPWRRVQHLAALDGPQAFEAVATSPFSRILVLGPNGNVSGYVLQLDVLAAGREAPIAGQLRPLIQLDPDTPLDRALARLKQAGQRAALVGTPERPLGLVTLKDLVEEISGELHRW